MPLIFNPMLPFNFEEKDDIRIFIEDDEGNDIDITEYVAELKTQLGTKVNTFQGSTQGNKVMITDPQGNVTTVAGVVMNQSEREKLASLTNPVLLKGIINSYEALYQVENPQVGWCYYVRFANGENDNLYKEYVYTADHGWELFGHFNASAIPQYVGGTATEIDNTFHVNLKYDPDVFEVDAQNRLKLKDLSYVAKCKTLAEINALSVNDIFHWQGANDQNIVVLDPDGTQTYIRFGFFYKKGETAIQRINKERESNAKEIVAGENISITEDAQNDRITINANYDNKKWGIGKNGSNQLKINGKFVKQVEDLDAYTDAPDGEIVQYIGETDDNYTNGYFYKFRSGSEYKTITIPANKKIVTIYHPDGTQEIGYEIDDELSINSAGWITSHISSIEPINGGILTNPADWYPHFNYGIAKVGDNIWVKNGNEYIWGEIVGWYWYIYLYNYSTSSESINRKIPQSIAESTSQEEATSKILQWLTENGYPQPTIYVVDNIKVKVLLDNGESYYLSSNGEGGYSQRNAVTLISPAGKKIFVRTDNVSELNIYKSTEIRKKGSEYYWYIDPDYNYPTYYTVDTLSESITLKVPVLYEEDGSLKNINSQNLTPSTWQRIDVQPTPNDVVMCKMLENKALAPYATPITRFKYIEDHGWVDMDRSNIQYNEGAGEWVGTFVSLDIAEGEYYYDMDNDTVFVADENLEMQEVTSTVIIQGDTNKLYCDVDTNTLYRYDGTDFVALTSEGKTYTLSSNDENIRLTDSDGQTQDVSLNTLINGLTLGNSDPQDDDYIVAQYAGGGTTTTTYTRRPLSKFWNWIKSKLGIGTNDGTFLRKDGTWATATDNTKVAKAGDSMTGNLITPALKISGGRVYGSGDDEGIVINPSSNGYAGVCLGTPTGKRSVFYFHSTKGAMWRYNDGSSTYELKHPEKSGTIATTSDIPELTSKSYNTSGGSCTVYKWGRICMASFSTTVSTSSGTIFTITDAAYRPLVAAIAVCACGTSETTVFYTEVQVGTDGKITYQGSMYRNGTLNVIGFNDSRPIVGTICYISAS